MIGTSLGPDQVVAKLGEGGMGEVDRATDSHLKRQVAIKVLPASAPRALRRGRQAWRRSRCAARRWTSARTSGRLARCCSRCTCARSRRGTSKVPGVPMGRCGSLEMPWANWQPRR